MDNDLTKIALTVINGSFLLVLVKITIKKFSDIADKVNALSVKLARLEEKVRALQVEHLTEQITKD